MARRRSVGGRVFRAVANLFDIPVLRHQFEKEYDKRRAEYIEGIAEEIRDEAIKLLERTTRNWKGGQGVPSLTGAPLNRPDFGGKPQFVDDFVTVTEDRIVVNIKTDNDLWFMLDKGTPPHVSKGETFLPRDVTRTEVGELDVSDNPVYAATLRHVPAGVTIGGIEGRGWSTLIAEELAAKFSGLYDDVEIDFKVSD